MTRIAFLTERNDLEADGESLTGGGLRSRSVLAALEAVHEVHVVPVIPAAGGNLYTRHRSLRDAGRLRELVGFEPAALHLDGLPLAHAARGAAAWGVPCVLDACDSWPLRYLSTLRRGTVSAAPGLVAALALLRSAGRASAVCYISDRDRDHDRSLLPARTRTFVVPNAVDPSLLAVPAISDEQRISSAADWRYPPNAEGLGWFLRRIWPLIERSNLQVDLYGPEAPAEQLPPGVVYRGWVPDKADIFTGAVLSIAPVRTGAGVKNKVVESLAAARPVVTTSEGAAGLGDLAAGMLVADSAADFAQAVERLAGDVTEAARMGAAGRAALLRRSTTVAEQLRAVYAQR